MPKNKKTISIITTDQYAKNWLKRIKTAGTDKILISIINKIYQDGYEDGANSN